MRVGRVEAFAVRYPEPNNDGKIRALTPGPRRDRRRTGRLGRGDHGRPGDLARGGVRRRAPTGAARRRPRPARRRGRSGPRCATRPTGTATAGSSPSASAPSTWRSGTSPGRPPGCRSTALLGGKRRDRLPACASTIFATDDLDRVGREFRGFVAEGYRYVKGGWGHDLSIAFGSDERRDLAIARAVRDAIGPDVQMIVDVVALDGLGCEPRHPDVPGDRRRRAASSGSRIRWSSTTSTATGGSAPPSTRASAPARRAGTRSTTGASSSPGGIDVIMIDPGRAEGVTGAWRVIEMAAAAGLAWNAHSWSSALNTAASLHLAAAAANTLLFELKPVPSPMQHELVTNPIDQVDGWVSPARRPGSRRRRGRVRGPPVPVPRGRARPLTGRRSARRAARGGGRARAAPLRRGSATNTGVEWPWHAPGDPRRGLDQGE